MKSYRSKIDTWLIVLLTIVFGIPILNAIYNQIWALLLIFLPVFLLIIYMFSTLKYIIDGDFLIIKFGFYTHSKININEIKSIEKSNNPLNSPASSLDRLSIKYNKYDEVLVSPKEKQNFIKDLLCVNAGIVVLKMEE